jgi:hypothetical protein
MEIVFILQVDGKKYRITEEILRKIPYLEIVKKYSPEIGDIRVMNSKYNKLFAIVLKAICDPITFTLRFFSLCSGQKRLLRAIQYYCVSINDIFQTRVDDATPGLEKAKPEAKNEFCLCGRTINDPINWHCLQCEILLNFRTFQYGSSILLYSI